MKSTTLAIVCLMVIGVAYGQKGLDVLNRLKKIQIDDIFSSNQQYRQYRDCILTDKACRRGPAREIKGNCYHWKLLAVHFYAPNFEEKINELFYLHKILTRKFSKIFL